MANYKVIEQKFDPISWTCKLLRYELKQDLETNKDAIAKPITNKNNYIENDNITK